MQENPDNMNPDLTPEQISADQIHMQHLRERIDEPAFHGAISLLHARLDASDILDMLPPQRSPTPIAREDFLLGKEGKLLEDRIETMRGHTLNDKKSQELPAINGIKYKRLTAGNTTLTAANFENIPIDKRPKIQKFAIRGIFEKATVVVAYNTDNEIKLTIEYPKKPGDEKPLIYNSKQLQREQLTTEENLIALHLIETAYLNLFDPQRRKVK